MSNWWWIIVLVIAVVGVIFIPKDNRSYKEYNCYDKSIYKCRKCRKRCKWHDVAKKAERLIDNYVSSIQFPREE